MSDRLGMVQLALRPNSWAGQGGGFMGDKPYSEETAKLIDMEVGRIIQECHDDAKRLLAEHRGELDALVAALMKEESLDAGKSRRDRLPPALSETPAPHLPAGA